ncbi:MAG: hypothetical protein HY270_24735 [Deltaproteobacteria bacterium]|nr:hypothetical protein [Deltaproteobacteria bacterium]
MLKIGDEVVTMSAAGRFKVVSVDGTTVTIENPEGIRKVVIEWNLRRIDQPQLG